MPLIIGKCRPRRVFKDENGRFFMLCNGNRKYLKPITRNGKVLTSLSDVQADIKDKVQSRIKINYVPNRKARDWKRQSKKAPIHYSKQRITLNDVVAAISKIGKPEAYEPEYFNAFNKPVPLMIEDKKKEDKKEEKKEEKKEIASIPTPIELPPLIARRKRGRPKGRPNRMTITEIAEETEQDLEEEHKPEPKPIENKPKKKWEVDMTTRRINSKPDPDDIDVERKRALNKSVMERFVNFFSPKDKKANQVPDADENELAPLALDYDEEEEEEPDTAGDEENGVEEADIEEKGEEPDGLANADGQAAGPPPRYKPAQGELNYNKMRRQQERKAQEEANRRKGKGKILSALWNDQIEKYFENEPRFAGTYSSDEINEVKKRIPTGFIINTAPSTADEGEHWQAVYIGPDSVEFYDSYGDDPSPEVKKALKKLIHSWNLPVMLKFKVNKVAAQKDKTDTCGYFAMRFLDERFNGIPFEQATRFKRPENAKEHVIHEENEGEATINKEFKLI